MLACSVRDESNWLIRGLHMEQQLLGKLNNTPTDTSHICSTVNPRLNREETLSVSDSKLPDNNLEENLHSGKSGLDLRVPVLNMRGKPLMLTTSGKARILVKSGKAKVVKRSPFVIQMLVATGEAKQEVILGIDSGFNFVGASVKTSKRELMRGELVLRRNVSKLLEQRRNYRKSRRHRLWHREPRFNNRKMSESWLPNSLQHKLDTHVRLINDLISWFPISKTIIEVASFDAQKMQNPEISGKEYQQGELQGYEIREYLLAKWGRKCAYCGNKDIRLEIEHIIPKSRGGSNRVSNLTIACKKCNLKKGKQTAVEFGFPDIQKQAKTSLKATVFMNVIRKRLAQLVNAEETFGYITKYNRIKLNPEKSHSDDAFVIAGGTTEIKCKEYTVTQTRRNNRSLQLNRKGFKPSIRRQHYKFQPNDLVRYEGKVLRVKGMHCRGTRMVLENKKSIPLKKVELVTYGKGLTYECSILGGISA